MQQAPKSAEVECVESLLLSGIGRPRLAAIKDRRQDTSLVDAKFGPFAQQVIAPHSLVEFEHDSSCFDDPAADLSIERSRTSHGGAHVGEGIHNLQLRVVDGDDWGGGGGGGGDSAPCARMLVFLRLIVSPNSLQARDSLSTRCWRPSSMWDVKAASSTNSSSRKSTE